jgi:phosphohistidine swiveling domain-containing protein
MMASTRRVTANEIVELLSESPRQVVGGKAYTLGVLARAGFPVPPGVVVPVGMAPDDLAAVVDRVSEVLGKGPFAVRSSAISEDGDEHSYAGLYDTVLWVEGAEALTAAIRRVASSGRSERVRSYGDAEAGGVPVLIQSMISADAAGVAFTADPVTADRDVIVVSAVRGVGETLVSGTRDPDEWEVRGGEVKVRRAPEAALADEQVAALADLAHRVENHMGSPQDIEWALKGDQLYLLQARPITGLPDVEPVQPDLTPPDEGSWMLDGGHYPTPISPSAASFYLPFLERSISAAFAEFGALIDGVRQEAVGWRVYGKVVPPGGKEGKPPPWWLMGALARVAPPIRKKMAKAKEAAAGGLGKSYIEKWWAEWRPGLQAEITERSQTHLSTLSDNALLDELDRRLDLLERGQEIHFKLFIPHLLAVHRFVRFCVDRLGWDETETVQHLSGISDMSSAPGRRLDEIADVIRSSTELTLLVESHTSGLDDLRRASTEAAGLIDGFLAEFGDRATSYDVLPPTIAERSDLLKATIRSLVKHPPKTTEPGIEILRHRGDSLQGETARPFAELLSQLETAFPVREDNILYTDNIPLGLMRLALLELGRRLVDRGLLADASHVFFLSVDEARNVIGEGLDLRAAVDQRRAERVWAERHAPAPTLGPAPPPPPDLRALPREARELMEALLWSIANDLATPPGDGLSGVGASPGVYRGKARVIRDEAEFARIEHGDVLVCDITTPAWSVLFPRIGAVVTNKGGLLSHAAIVAREHGIPAVLATGTATQRIEDGEDVTVDGTKGQIEIADTPTNSRGRTR